MERKFAFVERNLLNGRTFRSLDDLNEVTRWWLENVADVRIHAQTKQSPRERHQEELPHLIPLPAHPYDTAEVVYRSVSSEGRIVYCQNRYSVPWRYIGLMLPVRITEEEIVIYGPQIDEIARHRLLPRAVTGQTVVRKEHEPPGDHHKYEVLRQRYVELGPTACRFLEGLIQRRRYGKDEAQKVLALLETYRREDFLAAIDQAIRYGAYSRSAIERILAVKAVPKTALDQRAEQELRQLNFLLGEEPVQPRPGKEYDQLFDQHTSETASDETSEDSPGADDAPAGPACEDP